jgi:hypothetical protein
MKPDKQDPRAQKLARDTAELSRTSRAGRPPLPNPSPKTLSQRRYRAKLKEKQ